MNCNHLNNDNESLFVISILDKIVVTVVEEF